MSTALTLPGALLAALVSLHIATLVLAMLRCRTAARGAISFDRPPPPVTVIRPVSGHDFMLEETLGSTFGLDHPDYEILFCAASEKDPGVATVRALLAFHRDADARLLIGVDAISDNPKLNNVAKGWRAARHDMIVMTDSNVLLPRDYLARCLNAFDARAGMVAAPPAGTRPANLEADVEAAFLNSHQARWQYAADAIGLGFAQGKNLVFRRDVIEAGGGIRALASELAEDAAATKLVRRQGYEVRLARGPFAQPLGARDWRSVWSRQVRWARLRRMSFPFYYTLEIACGILPPTIIALWWALATHRPVLLTLAALWSGWYALEWILARVAGWPSSLRSLIAMILRDLAMPVLWIEGWRNRGFVWQGHAMARPQ